MKKSADTYGCSCTGCPGMRAALETIQRLEARILRDHEKSDCAVGRLEQKINAVLAKVTDGAPGP